MRKRRVLTVDAAELIKLGCLVPKQKEMREGNDVYERPSQGQER